MKIMVTGKSGQLACSLAEKAAFRSDVELFVVGRPEFDLTDRPSVLKTIAWHRPDIVVSAAAYTAVDRAEDEPELAYQVNVNGAAAVAEAAAKIGAPVIHISTDYVFGGKASELEPYTEYSETGPSTIYGLTKLQGEEAVSLANPKHVILRTSWLYSPFGSNFVKTMLRIAKERPTISVVSDQWGNPSSALDIADAILLIASSLKTTFGVFHVAGTGNTTWSEFARHIFAVSREHGGPFAEVSDIATAEYSARAHRPLNSLLCCDRARDVYGINVPHWKESAATIVRRVLPVT
jgi:dTDP-4-dehydrorhamnose reductase